MFDAMTIRHTVRSEEEEEEDEEEEYDDDDDDDVDADPIVDSATPPTIPNSDATSPFPGLSMPHMAATDALVNGSAALTVSTNAADPNSKPTFVNRNPSAKYTAVRCS